MPSAVVDSSLILRLLIDEPGSAQAQAQWAVWKRERADIAAPALLIYETVNALHQSWRHKLLATDEVMQAVAILMSFPIRYYRSLHIADRAAELARELQMGATYDGFYIALAETLPYEFWTGDRRLYHNVHKRFDFVRSFWDDGQQASPEEIRELP